MSSSNGVTITGTNVREVEVMAKPTRRRFSAEYKLKILREAGACIQAPAFCISACPAQA